MRQGPIRAGVAGLLVALVAGCAGQGGFLDGVDEVTPAAWRSTATAADRLHGPRIYCSILDSGETVDQVAGDLVRTAEGAVTPDEARRYIGFVADHCDEVYELTGGRGGAQ